MMDAVTVARRVVKQVVKDRRTLALLLFAPLFILFILYTVITSPASQPVIGLVDQQQAYGVLAREAEVVRYESRKQAERAMSEEKIDAYWAGETFVVEGTSRSRSKLSEAALSKTLAVMRAGGMRFEAPDIEYLYSSGDATLFDTLAPALMGFFIFFFVFIIAGISFLRERSTGTLERTLATPLALRDLVAGYFIGFFLFVSIQTILIQWFIIDVLDVPQNGNYLLLLFVNLLIATVALTLGLFLSSFARTEFQLFQFIPALILPQVFFSGIFDLSEAPRWVELLSNALPLTYAARALVDVMVRGKGFMDVTFELLILSGYAVAFVVLNLALLRKVRPS